MYIQVNLSAMDTNQPQEELTPVLKDYYVYAHIDTAKDEIFYIGKGRGKRAYDKDGRNPAWKEKVAELKGKYTVKFLHTDLLEMDAFDLENKYIREIGKLSEGKGPLVNWTDGGYMEGLSVRLEPSAEIVADVNKAISEAYDKLSLEEKMGLVQHHQERENKINSVPDLDKESKKAIAKEFDNLLSAIQDKFYNANADETDLEFALDTSIEQVMTDLEALGKNEIYTKDFYSSLVDEKEIIEDELEEDEDSSKKIRKIAKEFIEYINGVEARLLAFHKS